MYRQIGSKLDADTIYQFSLNFSVFTVNLSSTKFHKTQGVITTDMKHATYNILVYSYLG